MKKRLRTIVIFLIIALMMLSLFSCGKDSGISLSSLERKLSNETWEFSVSDNKFEYFDSSSISKITYSGTLNKNGSVKSIKIVNENIDTSILTDASLTDETIHKSGGSMRQSDIRACDCILQLYNLKELFGESSNILVDDVNSFFNRTPVKINGWTIKSNVNSSSKTVTITATYD